MKTNRALIGLIVLTSCSLAAMENPVKRRHIDVSEFSWEAPVQLAQDDTIDAATLLGLHLPPQSSKATDQINDDETLSALPS